MRRLALLAALILAACAAEPPPVAESFRDRSVPIGSTTRGSWQELQGEWVVSQSFPGTPLARATVPPGTRVIVSTAGLGFSGPGGAVDMPTVWVAPGRFRAQFEGARFEGPEFWVLWVDDDFRTAVIGTPDGSFGWIMDRPGQASADRTAAAREVLDWSGYDLSRLGA